MDNESWLDICTLQMISHPAIAAIEAAQSDDGFVTSCSWASLTLMTYSCLLSCFHQLPAYVSVIVWCARESGERCQGGCVCSRHYNFILEISWEYVVQSRENHRLHWLVTNIDQCPLTVMLQHYTGSHLSAWYYHQLGLSFSLWADSETSWTGNSYHNPIPNQKISFKFLQEFGCCDLGR